MRRHWHVGRCLALQFIIQKYCIENNGSDDHRACAKETEAECENSDKNRDDEQG